MNQLLEIFKNSSLANNATVKINLIVRLHYIYDKKLQGYSFKGSGFPYNNNPINVYPYNVSPKQLNMQLTAGQIEQYTIENYVAARRLHVTVQDEKQYNELLNLCSQIPDISCYQEVTNKQVLKPEFLEEFTKRRDLRIAHMEKIKKHVEALKELGVEIEEMVERWSHWKNINDDPLWYQDVFNYGTLYINYHEGTEFWDKMDELDY